MLDSDEEIPFDMEQIKTTSAVDKPDRELVNFVLAKLEPEAKMPKLSPTKSEPIKSEVVTSHIVTASNAKAVAAEKKAKRFKRALAIVEGGGQPPTIPGSPDYWSWPCESCVLGGVGTRNLKALVLPRWGTRVIGDALDGIARQRTA